MASFDLYNKSNPYSMNLGFNPYSLNLNQTNNLEISSQNIEINTDSNFIESYQEKQEIISSDYKFLQNYQSSNENLATILLFLNPIKILYYRKCMKLQECSE